MKKFIVLMLCCLFLTGCTAPSAPTENTPSETHVETKGTQPPATEAPAPETEAPVLTFTVYYGNENVDGFYTTEVEVPLINETVVLEKLIEAGVVPDTVAINSISSVDNQLNIDFNGAFYDYLCTMGTSGEMILIGSVVNTFLNAYQAESIFLTADGQIMESGHMIYDFPLEFHN